ncbi:MAG: DnaJ domain-containing protein [Gammaproteobacteria bacterium]|nr:DnaJ domain-containing protein [Gammaproteobacteria bacterium]
MTERYLKNYRILGIAPGATWKELRQAYKSLVNTWHPDRFQQNPQQKKWAEEKTKEITQSYQELAEYHKTFGVLPIEAENRETLVPQAPTVSPAPARQPAHSSHSTTSDSETGARTSKRRSSTFVTRIVFSAALIGAVYLVSQLAPEKQAEKISEEAPAAEAAGAQEHPSFDPLTAPPEKYITIGTPLGEVYAIQGVPTKTEKDIWFYGASKIYFSQGAVTRWEESPDHPLRVKITAEGDKPALKFFSNGSSKAEVLAAQGAPDRDVGNVWDYGVSRVYFDKEQVSGWHNSPLNPLKLRR